MDDRKLTVIIVPDGDPETRTLHIPYRRLKLFIGAGALLVVLFIVMASSWWYVAAQAARVPGLERQVSQLEQERAKVAELARMLSEVEQQYEKVRQMLGAGGDGSSGEAAEMLPPLREEPTPGGPERQSSAGPPTSWPLVGEGFITQEKTADARAGHPGIDIAVPHDTYIRAAGAGTVVESGRSEIYGHYVRIAHAGGYETVYGHASVLFVAEGDPVESHEVIALSGSTGRSTAPHLHFEVWRAGVALDPLTVVERP
ncbi:MAG: peptidoglycan DD-metalloendopeptidase family protein [Longimicrobiales bacterium]